MANPAPSSALHANDEDLEHDSKAAAASDSAPSLEVIEAHINPNDPATWPIERKAAEWLRLRAVEDGSRVILATGVAWEVFKGLELPLCLSYDTGTVYIKSVPDIEHGRVGGEVFDHFKTYTNFYPGLYAENNSKVEIPGMAKGHNADVQMRLMLDDAGGPLLRSTVVAEVMVTETASAEDIREYIEDYLMLGEAGALLLIKFWGRCEQAPVAIPPNPLVLPAIRMVAVLYERPPLCKDPDEILPSRAISFGTDVPSVDGPIRHFTPVAALLPTTQWEGVGFGGQCNALGQLQIEIPASLIYHGRANPPAALPDDQLTAGQRAIRDALPAGQNPPMRIDLYRIQQAFFGLPVRPGLEHPF